MAIEVFNRYEGKFLIDQALYEQIEHKLRQYMELTEFNRMNGFYHITNLYYDTGDNQLIRHSLSRPQYKQKFRIRAYGVPKGEEKVFLEIKKKVCGLVNKRRTQITLDEAYDFIASGIRPELKSYMNKQVINEIAYSLQLYDLEPKLYIAYERQAFFGKEDRGLRITFDTNIRTRRSELKLEDGDHGEALLERNQWLMEVKTERNVPLWLSKLLSEYKVFRTRFSKYGSEYERMLADNRREKGERIECLTPYQAAYSAQPQLAHQYL
ncbi:VTC domain-containing protein [Paenibacillus sophorae]|uniref:Polyphosphate polymerase domain-containing protein n=1 Tax=Paenibacillus sophorae TaxID=1333845 RepID=A0A1H8MNN6_9BACL|nr:polyphosphate polymerase domain-containing protein [Paenibacillus sophorae]QWU17889.1 polyphosphate polymerase domain-containing protein [Paenibacillus sophorae]SEO19061.1 VTC domain-containing protein [Paenibacillus sophorae]